MADLNKKTSGYSGFLLKIGNYIVPTDKFISAESYSVTYNVMDLDSYRDANGKLHREALEHVPIKVEFETPAMLTDITFGQELMGNIRKNYTNARERKCIATAYIPELDSYVTQEVYMVTPTPQIYGNYGGRLHYKPIRMAFVGY